MVWRSLGDGFNGNALLPERILPPPQPVLSAGIVSGTNLQFKATSQFAGTFYLLAGTNITQPFSQWTGVLTNSVNTRSNNNFSATLSNAVGSSAAQQFYILQSQ